jgi:hypothetical protein
MCLYVVLQRRHVCEPYSRHPYACAHVSRMWPLQGRGLCRVVTVWYLVIWNWTALIFVFSVISQRSRNSSWQLQSVTGDVVWREGVGSVRQALLPRMWGRHFPSRRWWPQSTCGRSAHTLTTWLHEQCSGPHVCLSVRFYHKLQNNSLLSKASRALATEQSRWSKLLIAYGTEQLLVLVICSVSVHIGLHRSSMCIRFLVDFLRRDSEVNAGEQTRTKSTPNAGFEPVFSAS